MKIVTVIPLEKGPFKTDLTYFTSKDIKNGSIVSATLRNKKILGLVVSSTDASNMKSGIKDMSFKLKKIIEVKEQSIFRPEFIEAAFDLGSYFISNKNSAVVSFIPSLFREKYDELAKITLPKKTQEKIEHSDTNRDTSIKTEKLLFQASLEDRISYYKTFIRGMFAGKKSVFIVLPTEYDIEIFTTALGKGIENFTFAMHGGLRPKKIMETYKAIMNSSLNSSHGVLILGTAPFLSIPRADVGAIIVEHESLSAYKMIPRPHFDARIFAELYAAKINAKFILADTLLRFETIARKELENLSEIYPLSFRTNLNDVAISIPKNTLKKTFAIFSEQSLEEIQNAIKSKRNIFIFSLRKGLATYTICKNCNETINCEKCLAPLVLYLSRDGEKRMFVCNKCNTEKSPETVCANCGSWNLIPLGIGVDTVLEEIKNKLPLGRSPTGELKTKIFKLDKESVKSGSAAEKIIKEFEKSQGAILVATEMAFFYLTQKVDLSIVASFDALWSIPNYKMSEKIIQLLLSILGKTERKLIIQTKNENDPAILALKSENLLPFVREELEDRKNLGYPPYKRFIKITYLGDKEGSIEAKNVLQEIFKNYNPEIFGGFIAKNINQYVTNALIKLEPKKWSLPELSLGSSIDPTLKNLLSSLPFSYEVSVDPEDLL